MSVAAPGHIWIDAAGVAWIEEPIRHDDYRGCARLAQELKTPYPVSVKRLKKIWEGLSL